MPRSTRAGLTGFTFALLALGGVQTATAAEATGGSIPCAGVWKLDESMTHRTRSTDGPFYQFFEPWGKDGWMRMNTQGLDKPLNGGEWHFERLNMQPYQVFGSDPSLGKARKITDRIIEATRVREGEEANTQYAIFSDDCSHVTMYKAEGTDRHGPPGKQHFYNDIRVFARVDPPAGTAARVADVFGGWMLNRTASKLTIGPMNAETVVLIPWGKTGWIWNQISGGPYQPEDLHKKVTRVECGATTGATARACAGPPPNMKLYWAGWDAKTYPSYGSAPGQVQLKRLSNTSFELTTMGAQAAKSTVAFAPDGKRMTVTTNAGGKEDVRVYDRIQTETWPVVKE
jgi:hypothetical protein